MASPGDHESLTEKIAVGVYAFGIIFCATEVIGVVVLVGAFDWAPRTAGLVLLAPAALVAATAAARRAVRRFVFRYLWWLGG